MGVRVGGYLRINKVSEEVIEPIFARALCLRVDKDPRSSVIVMSCDLVGFQYRLARLVREAIARKTGVPVARIILHFTHSHSSPDTIGIFPNRIANLLTFDVQYPVVTHIMTRMVRAGIEAFNGAITEAKVGYGETASPSPTLAVQRRPPYEHLSLPIRFLKITDKAGKLLAIIVNYQAHPTQLPARNANIHPEYPGIVAKALYQKRPGLEFAAYFNGFAGDVTIHGFKGFFYAMHRDGKSYKDAMNHAVELVEKLGNIFADHVLAAVDGVNTEPITTLAVKRHYIFPRVGRIKSVWSRFKYYKGPGQKIRLLLREFRDALRVGLFHDFYKFINGRYLPMLNIITNGRRVHHQTEIFVIRLNDIYWFSAPGEPFVTYQRNLMRHVASGKHIFSQMSETCGYIYPWNFYVEGGYEKFFSFDALFGRYLYDSLLATYKQLAD